MRKTSFLFCLFLLLLGCRIPAADSTPEDTSPDLSQLQYTWLLKEIEQVPSSFGLTLTFREDGSLEGHGGCNRFTGTYVTGVDNSLRVIEIAHTLLACLTEGNGNEIIEREVAYFSALQQVVAYELTDNGQQTLLLYNDDDDAILRFAR